MRHYVFLVPGFFGFSRLGNVEYFRHVERVLVDEFRGTGEELILVPVRTLPTASIRKRAKLLAMAVEEQIINKDDKVHIIGHSTGGLDARLLVTPGVSLEDIEETTENRVDNIFTIATPHYGTPVAGFFTHLAGKHLLLSLSLVLMVSMRSVGGRSYAWLGRILSYVTRLDDFLGLDNTVLDYMTENLLGDMDEERRNEVLDFVHSISTDQGAMLQITPEGMDIFNAACIDKPTVAYHSYLTCATRPGLRAILRTRWDPYFPASYSVFTALHRLTARSSNRYPYPPFPESLIKLAFRLYEFIPKSRDNDGVVPTCSQPWGRTCGLILGDHLDVCGHFANSDGEHHHTDWLRSASGFDRETFLALYRDIAARILGRPVPSGKAGGFMPSGG